MASLSRVRKSAVGAGMEAEVTKRHTRDRNGAIGACMGKERFATLQAARAVLERSKHHLRNHPDRRPSVRVAYRCSVCGHVHVGKPFRPDQQRPAIEDE